MTTHTPEPEPAHDWAEDLAHERLVDETRSRLAAARAAAAGAEAATIQLTRDFAVRRSGGRG